MAVHYQLKYEETTIPLQSGSTDDNDDLFLCWVSNDGVPHHFRRMRPIRDVTDSADNVEDSTLKEGQGHGNLRGGTNHSTRLSASRNQSKSFLVTEYNLIETTYPGHAFVVCRRVGTCADDRDGSDPIVVCENEMTYFLRRAKECEHKEGDNVVREKYLVVGGYRPGPMLGAMEDEDGNNSGAETSEESEKSANDDHNGTHISVGSDESSHDGKLDECNNDSDDEIEDESNDESDDEIEDGELLLQLLTIQYVKKNLSTNGTNINPAKRELEEEEDHNPLSKSICCSNFLSGIMREKSRHARAFVATKYDDSAIHKLLQNDENQLFDDRALTVSVHLSRLDSTPLDTSTKHYDKVILGGWPCYVEPGCFPPDMALPADNGKNLLRLRFELDLMAASLSLPPKARTKLKHCTPIWINKSQSYGPKSAPVRARDACFHPGAGWLKKVGMSPAKCGGIEFFDAMHYLSDCDLWGPGGLMLHELSHAWHSKFIEDGYDNKDIIDTYENAMEDGLYNCVRVHGPQGPTSKAYACQDQMEYFAELSVAFLGGLDEEEHNKWYPFNRSQLRDHDPRAFAMLCRMWGAEDALSGHEDGDEAANMEN